MSLLTVIPSTLAEVTSHMPVDGVSVKTGFYFLLNGINLVMVEVNTLDVLRQHFFI